MNYLQRTFKRFTAIAAILVSVQTGPLYAAQEYNEFVLERGFGKTLAQQMHISGVALPNVEGVDQHSMRTAFNHNKIFMTDETEGGDFHISGVRAFEAASIQKKSAEVAENVYAFYKAKFEKIGEVMKGLAANDRNPNQARAIEVLKVLRHFQALGSSKTLSKIAQQKVLGFSALKRELARASGGWQGNNRGELAQFEALNAYIAGDVELTEDILRGMNNTALKNIRKFEAIKELLGSTEKDLAAVMLTIESFKKELFECQREARIFNHSLLKTSRFKVREVSHRFSQYVGLEIMPQDESIFKTPAAQKAIAAHNIMEDHMFNLHVSIINHGLSKFAEQEKEVRAEAERRKAEVSTRRQSALETEGDLEAIEFTKQEKINEIKAEMRAEAEEWADFAAGLTAYFAQHDVVIRVESGKLNTYHKTCGETTKKLTADEVLDWMDLVSATV